MANCSMQLAYAEDSAVRLTSALVTLTPKYGFPGLIFEHLCVNYGDPSCVGF